MAPLEFKINRNWNHMTRCDYDIVFYRVFCVTLLAIAFSFTIILTNVFIDIDGLIAGKDKHRGAIRPKIDMIPEEFTSEAVNGDDISYGDSEDSYRTKRSMETQNFLFHIKNPKIKNILTSRLETLLEALDAEEPPQNAKTDNNIAKDEIKVVPPDELAVVDEIKMQNEKIKKQKQENMLHLTMHNVLLQGIIGHMDLNEVYKRVNSLMKNLDEARKEQKVNERSEEKSMKNQQTEMKPITKPSLDDRLVAELIKCNDLQDQILSSAVKKVANETNSDTKRVRFEPPDPIKQGPEEDPEVENASTMTAPQGPQDTAQTNPDIAIKTKLGPNLLIKTTVDIRSIENDRNDTISKENIHGIIEVIYNGKSIKFTRPDTEEPALQKKTEKNINQPKFINSKVDKAPVESTSQSNPLDDVQTLKKIPKMYLNNFIAEYFKHFSTENKDEEIKERIETKRLKRHVKIKFNQEKKGTQVFHQETKPTKKDTEDDELYVEIETHFDSKGMKGERKKKLIRSLIDKIQKAIHSEENKKVEHETTNTMLKHKPLHVKKRLQNPLEHRDQGLNNKHMVPVSNIVHRQLNPIIVTQSFPSEDNNNGPNVRDRSGEAWKKPVVGPTFLTATKSINSAEMSEVEVDYNRVLDVNGIPQRLQKPLNTDMSDETVKPNSYFDLGNMKFFIKDIDGSGFSIGFNQYVDEPPDPETMNLFTGLENVIKTYHQNVDQEQEGAQDVNLDLHDNQDTTGAKNNHIIVRRSVNHQHDYHSNEYKIIYDGNFLPFNDYKDIYERENSKPNMEYSPSQYHESPLVVDEHIFDKNLKPAEIFGLANLFRKKRSLKVKKITNLKSKMKLNRYLNTKAMSTKRIFLNRKRHKRQISKIRIIASDLPYKRSSDANIFLVSGENVFADRAIVKDVETADAEGEKIEDSEYTPYQPEESESLYKEFESKSRRNNLMSKYPHVFMEEISRSKEDSSPVHSLLFGKIPGYRHSSLYDIDGENADYEFTSDTNTIRTIPPELDISTEPIDKIRGVNDILAALQSPKTNYKVTVKVTPKNLTKHMHPGFKEIHTSINKIYNKNGLMYTSLVNVSEISNITHVNKSENKEPDYNKAADAYLAKQFKAQHEKMQSLLKQHQKLINEQLAKLNKEKSNIESILIDENNTVVPHFDFFDLTPSKSHKVLHMGRDEVNKMADIILNNKNRDSFIPETRTVTTTSVTTPTTTTPTTTTPTTTILTTTVLTTTEQPLPLTIKTTMATLPSFFTEKLKKNLLHTIERNEKLTDQILRKVDKNTEILQTFLNKLTNTIDTQKSDLRTPLSTKDEITESYLPKFEHMHPFSIDWRQHGGVPFNSNMIRKNSSHIAIPFLYAYQHPIMPLKMNSPVASVVYHGTIHTNSLHAKEISAEKEKIQPTLKIPTSRNQTRFFIDEVESDYKVIPVNNVEKPQIFKNITTT